MARENMHLAVPRINKDLLGIQLGGSDSLPRKYHKQKHCKSFSEAHRVPSLSWRNSDDRCPVLTFLTFEPNGHWRIVSVPLHYSDSELLGSDAQVSMDCLNLVPRPIDSAQADRQIVAKTSGIANSAFTGSALNLQSQSKASNRTTWKELPKNLLCKSFTNSKSSSPTTDSFTTIRPTTVLTNDSAEDNAAKKSSGKKNKKKPKRGKKNPCRTGSTEPEVLLKDDSRVGSVSATCDSNDVDHKGTLRPCISRSKEVEMSERARLALNKGVTPHARESEAGILNVRKDTNHAQFNDMPQSSVSDNMFSCPNSNHGTKSSHSSKRWEKENARADFSLRPPSSSRKGSSVCRSLPSTAEDICFNTNKTSHVRQGSSGKNLHLATPHRSVQNQTFSQFSNVNGYRSVGNYRGQTGKESTRAVWQKVQRNSTNDNASDSNRAPTPSQLDVSSNAASLLKRKSDKLEHPKQLKDTVCSEWRTKIDSALKEECNFSSESESDSETVISDSARVTEPPSEMSCISRKTSDQDVTTRDSISPPTEWVCSKSSGLKSQTIGGPNHLLVESYPLDQSKTLQVASPVSIPDLFGNSVRQALESIYLTDSGVQDRNCGCNIQKWIPIGVEDLRLTSSAGSSSEEQSDEPTSENTVKNKVKQESQYLVSKAEECTGQTAGDVSQSRKDECRALQSADQQEGMFEGQRNKITTALCSNIGNGVSVVPESALDKIEEAVNQAYKLQLQSEAIEKASGCPLAEIERFLQKASPVIYQPIHSICGVCSRDRFCGISLCKHEKPNVPLSSIWKWYEELGVCGLEVNGDDYENAKRFSADFVSFSAYFVPYLSAVQLFSNGHDQSGNSSNNISGSEVGLEGFPTEPNQVCSSEPSSVSAKDSGCLRSVVPSTSNDPELLFEYFESEAPQQRRPLYEKIQQLVVSDGLSQYQGQGDPTNLDRVKLNELHHKSWYSVAWYPIYRIPEAIFRAAFLTFHSLGHLMCRSSRFDSNGVQECVVCPAVGLQSYNAQAECWFSPRSSMPNHKKAIAPDINRREILKERLRTLEETADLMARAVVKKGNLTSVNRHPDYEFFCSRRRC